MKDNPLRIVSREVSKEEIKNQLTYAENIIKELTELLSNKEKEINDLKAKVGSGKAIGKTLLAVMVIDE